MEGRFKSDRGMNSSNGFIHHKHLLFGKTFDEKPNFFTSVTGLERDVSNTNQTYWGIEVIVRKLWTFGADVYLNGLGHGVKSVTISWAACL